MSGQGMNETNGQRAARRMSVRYEGRVQGVGFRYTVLSTASGFDVSGYVRNEMDGTVTLVAEGAEPELVAFLRAIKETRLGRYISAERCAWAAATGEFSGFRIADAW